MSCRIAIICSSAPEAGRGSSCGSCGLCGRGAGACMPTARPQGPNRYIRRARTIRRVTQLALLVGMSFVVAWLSKCSKEVAGIRNSIR